MTWSEALLTALLHIALYEVLGIRLEHFVNFFQEIVEFGFDLLALIGGGRRFLDDLLVPASGGGLLLLLTLGHVACSSFPTVLTARDARRSRCIRPSTYRRDSPFHVLDPSSVPGVAGRLLCRTPSTPSSRQRSG